MEVLVPDVNKKLSCFGTELVKEYAVILVILECKYLLNGNYVLNELSSRCTIGIEIDLCTMRSSIPKTVSAGASFRQV